MTGITVNENVYDLLLIKRSRLVISSPFFTLRLKMFVQIYLCFVIIFINNCFYLIYTFYGNKNKDKEVI